MLAEDDISKGWLTLGRVTAGKRAFFGNDCVAPYESNLGSDVLLGVKSIMPRNKTVSSNTIHFGSPSIPLPTRQRIDISSVSQQTQSSLTYTPSNFRWYCRGLFELIVLPFPLLILTFFGYVGADFAAQYYIDGRPGMVVFVFVAVGPALGVFSLILMLAVKWTWMGTYRPGHHFMWSW